MQAVQRATKRLKTTNGYEEQLSNEIDLRGYNLGLPEISCIKLLLCNPALTTLKLCYNKLAHKNVGEALAEGLAQNCSITELSIVGIYDHQEANDSVGFAKAFVRGFEGNTRLTKLVFGGDEYWTFKGSVVSPKIIPEPATLEVGMTEADLSNKNLGVGGAIMVSAWILHKDNGALAKLIFGDKPKKTKKKWEPGVLEIGMTKADFSSKNLGAGGAIIISAWISHKDDGAMTSLDISANNLGQLVLPTGWTEDGRPRKRTYKHANGRVQKEHPGKPEGVIALADAIKKSWALEKLLMAKNNLCNKKAGKALATMLAGNTTLKELDVSDNQGLGAYDGPGFAQELANGVKNNWALAKLIFGGDQYYDREQRKVVTPEPAVLEVGMTEADFSNKNLRAGGAVIVGAWISHKDNGALVSLDISDNRLKDEGAKIIAKALKAQKQLVCDDGKLFKSRDVLARSTCKHCGNKKDVHATRGTLVKFTISNNDIGADGGKALAGGLKNNNIIEELNIAGNRLGLDAWDYNTDMSGVLAIADAIPTMRAMVSLDISDNCLEAEGAKILAKALKAQQQLVCDDGKLFKSKGVLARSTCKHCGNKKDVHATRGALMNLNISRNYLGRLEFVEDGWSKPDVGPGEIEWYYHTDGREQTDIPPKEPKGGAMALADAIKNNGTLTSLNISDNQLGELVLPKGWTMQVNSDQTAYEFKHTDGTVRANHPGKREGFLAIANAIPTMGALTSLNILNNNLFADEGKALAEALKGNNVMQELNMSFNNYDSDVSGVIAISDAISTMGALMKLNIDYNKYTLPHLIRTMKHMIIECALNHRRWLFIRLCHRRSLNSAEIKGIKEIHALAEAFCMNALPGRTCTPRSNVGHPLRTPWLLRIVVDHLL